MTIFNVTVPLLLIFETNKPLSMETLLL